MRGRSSQGSQPGGADEAAEPLLNAEHRVDITRDKDRGSSAEREPDAGEHPNMASSPQHPHLHTGGTIRFMRRVSTTQEAKESGAPSPSPAPPEHAFTLALKEQIGEEEKEDNDREIEVEILTEAVAEAVADAVNEVVQEVVHDAVTEAVHDAVVQAIEENVNFDVRANVYTLVAVTGVVLFWRGVWNTWDYLFGLSIWSELACIATGLCIMMGIRLTNVPLAQLERQLLLSLLQGLPGG